MEVHQTVDVEEYAAAATDFLESQPASRNLLRTVIEMVRTGGIAPEQHPWFWWATQGDVVVAAASWTPPFKLLVSDVDVDAAEAVLEAAQGRARSIGVPLAGVTGPRDAARRVAHAWEEQSGGHAHVEVAEILHHLGELREPPEAPGRWRRAEEEDVATLSSWMGAFAAEAGMTALPNPAHYVAIAVAARRFFVWEDEETVVSMVAHSPAVSGVARIGPVYTPSPHRQHGYARRLTYEVARELLRGGVSKVILYTDAGNPTSNSIYGQVGFHPVEEHREYAFPAT